MSSDFIICKGYIPSFIEKRKLVFYHIPKCAGTSVCNVLSSLIDNHVRLLGPLTPNSGFSVNRPQFTSEDFFSSEKENVLNKSFIYGHFSINLYNYFLNSLSITLIRNPVDRTFSHYNYQRQRKIIHPENSLKECFDEGYILDNTITRQFSGNLHNNININDYELALKNLRKKIDLIFDFQDASSLINYIISIYDLPNVIFQKQRITKKNYLEENHENISIIKLFNKYDIKLFNKIKKENLFFSNTEKNNNRVKNKTLFWAQNDPTFGNSKIFFAKNADEILLSLKKTKK